MSQRYEIISHFKKKDWKKRWNDKIIYDDKKNRRDLTTQSCMFGQFYKEDQFYCYFHKEFQNSLMATYFMGKIETTDTGCKITGQFSKRRTANIFLVFAAALTAVAAASFIYMHQMNMAVAPAVLCIVCIICLVVTPRESSERILDLLKEVSGITSPDTSET